MHVDERHLLVADPGDGVQITTLLRQHDYGAMLTPEAGPLLGINHVTGNFIGPDPRTPAQDGTAGIAARVAAGARFYAQLELPRCGDIFLNLPLNRCAIHCEHSWRDPVSRVLYSINRVSIGMEWAGCGWIRATGKMPGKSGIDLTRPDLVKRGHLYWQVPTAAQIHTATLVWRAVLDRYDVPAENLIRGHGELAHGGHELCPGPLILEALRNVTLPALLGEVPPVSPLQVMVLGGEPNLCEAPADIFAEHGGTLEDDELPRYFTADEIERYARCGALTHDDELLQQSTLAWHWNPAALEEAA